jgi:hypothetical protein
MTEILESTRQNNHTDTVIENLEFESNEQARERIIGAAILAQTINLDTRHDSSFQQSKTPEYFAD